MHMSIGESLPYTREFFHLEYPAEWTVREQQPLGEAYFSKLSPSMEPYREGIALISLPATTMPIDKLVRTGLFFITRDLDHLSVEHTDGIRDGSLAWHTVIVRGKAQSESGLVDVKKFVVLSPTENGVIVLAAYGTERGMEAIRPTFDTMRRSVSLNNE